MSFRQRQSSSTYEGSCGQFNMSLELTIKTESLRIQVKNKLTRVKYSQIVDDKFIATDNELNCFRDAVDIFDFLVNNFNEIAVEEGGISFLYFWGGARRKERRVTIDLVRQELGGLQQAHRKIDVLMQMFTANDRKFDRLIRQKDYEIADIKSRLQGQENEIQLLQDRCQQMEQIIQGTEQKIATYQEHFFKKQILGEGQYDLRTTNEVLQVLEERVLEMEDQLSQSKKKLFAQMKSFCKKADILFGQEGRQLTRSNIQGHPQNFSHNKFFSIRNTEYKYAEILRQGQSKKWYNFVYEVPLLPKGTTEYRVKIIKTAYKCIMMGFCAAAGLGNPNNYNHAQSVYYDCCGFVYERGAESKGIGQSGEGDLVDCRADLFTGIISWWNNGQLLKGCNLSQEMQHKTLYFSVLMYETGDEFGISV